MEDNSLSRRSNMDPSHGAVVQTVAFKLTNYPPKIRLYEVIIWTARNEETFSRAPIMSNRMRKLALQALVDDRFACFKGRVSIRLSADKDFRDGMYHPIDHIMVLWGNDDNDQEHLDRIESTFQKRDIQEIPNVSRSSKTKEGILTQESLSYQLCGLLTLDPNKPAHQFSERLQFLLRDLIPPESGTDSAEHKVQRKVIGECKNKPTRQETENAASPPVSKTMSVDQDRSIRLYYVMHPKLDLTLDRQLRCEIAVSTGLKHGTVLCDPVRSIYGEFITGRTFDRAISFLRTMLVGLEVTRTYLPVAAQGTRCRIRQLRHDSDLGWFKVNGKGASMSIKTYFEEHLREKIKYPGYPYAQIGLNAWVPIEKLQTCGAQVFQCPSLVMERFTSLIRSSSCLEDTKDHRHMVVPVFDRLREIEQWGQSIRPSPSFMPRLAPTSKISPGEKKSVIRAQLPVEDSNTTIKAGFLYVASKSAGGDHHAFITSLSNRFFINKQTGGAEPIVRIDPDFKDHVVAMTDTKPLTKEDWMPGTGVPGLELFGSKPPNSVIAIVDETARDSQAYLDICADLQVFGNRTLGAVVIWVSRKTIKAQLIRHEGNAEYFPHLLLHRLRAMHGEANFNTETFQSLAAKPVSEKAPLLVLGGYLSNPSADSTKHCPSVATLVANLDSTMVNWPGEVRLQSAWEDPMTEDGPQRYLQAKMRDLGEMVGSRLDSWTSGQPRVVFYRHGLDSCPKNITKDIVEAEIQAIRDAMAKRYHGVVDLTYILVHHKETHPLGLVKATGTVTGSFEMEGSNKYDYDVMYTSRSENKMIFSDLQQLTRNLNQNYQQSNDGTIAIVLPVHYAKKLASRTFEYIRFAKTDNFNTVPSEKYRMYFGAHQAEQGMCQKLKNYLLGAQSPAVETQTAVNVQQEPPARRKNPWHPDLDKKMFYL